MDEQGLEAIGIHPAAAEQGGLMRRSAEVEAGDHPQNPDPAQPERSARALSARAPSARMVPSATKAPRAPTLKTAIRPASASDEERAAPEQRWPIAAGRHQRWASSRSAVDG